MLLSVARKELLSKIGVLSGEKASRVTLDVPSCDILSVSVLIFFCLLVDISLARVRLKSKFKFGYDFRCRDND